jgi:hypothetical protein
MQRPLRAFVFMLLIAVAYNLVVIIATLVRAPALTAMLELIAHGHGFTLGIAAGCLATEELGVLGAITVAILLVTWPSDLVRLSFALVSGGLLGLGLRSFIQSHRHDRQSVSGDRHTG